MKLVWGQGVFCPIIACISPKPLTCRNLCQTLLCTLTPPSRPLSTDIALPSFPNSRPLLWKRRRGHTKPISVTSLHQATQFLERKGSPAFREVGMSHSGGTGFDKAVFAAWEPHLPGVWGASRLSCSQGWPCRGFWVWAL